MVVTKDGASFRLWQQQGGGTQCLQEVNSPNMRLMSALVYSEGEGGHALSAEIIL